MLTWGRSDEKINVKESERLIQAPMSHELNGEGTDCAVDCPACRWAAESVQDKGTK